MSHCKNCVHKDTEQCPMWVGPEMGFMERNTSGQYRHLTGCFYPVMLRLVFDLAKSIDGAAQSVQKTRNDISNGFLAIAKNPEILDPKMLNQLLEKGKVDEN